MQKRTEPLNIFGAKGLQNLLEKFDRGNDYELFKQPFPLEIREVEPLEKFEILPSIEAVAISTPHTEESLAIHLSDSDNRRIVYTADTGFTEDLVTLARNVDLLVMECSFFRNKPVETHLELAEAMYLTRAAKPKRVVLTHLYPEWDNVDFQKEVKKFSPSYEVIEAKDGLRLEIIKEF
jgi:ribonuclease BN (tRNA processing enzyme)